MSPFCKVERLGKHIKLKYFQKVRFCGAQIPKFEKKSFKNAEIWGNLKKPVLTFSFIMRQLIVLRI